MATAEEFAIQSWKEGISDGNQTLPAGQWLTSGANEAYRANHDGPQLCWDFPLDNGEHTESAGVWLMAAADQAYLAHHELTEAVATLTVMVQQLLDALVPPVPPA